MSTTYALWDGTSGPISGSTPFGLYDTDVIFQADGPKVANYCARKLGYPIVDIELQSGSFFTCFEEAITEYSAQVNQFNIKDNLLSARGVDTGSNLTQTNIATNMSSIVQLAEGYGNEAGLYSNITMYTGSIEISSSVQDYDIKTLYTDVYEPTSDGIVIQKVHHYQVPALVRFFDPYAGTGAGAFNMLSEFGFSGMSPAASFVLMPMFEDILRMQSIEFNDTTRRSAYSFYLYNNKLKIFPLPKSSFRLYFEYYKKSDINDITGIYKTNTMSDFSNVTYNNMNYSKINDVGKQWIRAYTYALTMELLGNIRNKYSSIPIPDGDITLDGGDLISNGQSSREILMSQLREMLEQTSKKALMEAKAEEAEHLESTLQRIPLKIYIG